MGALYVLAVVLSVPGSAEAACGGVQRAQPERRGAERPPLAVGDSTMLLALPALQRRGFAVNAHGCRQIGETRTLLGRLAKQRRLPRVVIVAIGTDGVLKDGDIASLLRILGPGRRLGLVTPIELGGRAGADAETVRRAARRHPQRIVLIDWHARSRGHGNWFQPDGTHLTFTGATAFARILAAALPALRPDAPAVVLNAGAYSARTILARRWRVRLRQPSRVVLRTPGRCGARIVLRASVLPAAAAPGSGALLDATTPPGVKVGHRSAADRGSAHQTWRLPGTNKRGGRWVRRTPDGLAFVVVDAELSPSAPARCEQLTGRRLEGALFTALGRFRLS